MPTRILIATTQGPVEVQRITEEDPEVNSVVCLAGKAAALPISSAYNSFVRDPTGVIQKNFGHSAYRVDVSAPVDDGFSWQLGVFVAHAFAAEEKLLSGGPTQVRTIFVTGEVDRDLNVLPVDHVPVKLEKLARALSEGQVERDLLSIYLPSENAAQIEESWLIEIGLGPDVCRVVSVARVADLLNDLGLDEGPGPNPSRGSRDITTVLPSVPTAAPIRMFKWGLGIAAGLAIFALGSLAVLGSTFADWIELASAGKYQELETALEKEGSGTFKSRLFHRYLQWSHSNAVTVLVWEKRPPKGLSCKSVHFGMVKAESHLVKQQSGFIFAPSSLHNLCGLVIRATSENSEAYLWGRYEWWASDRPLKDEMPVLVGPRFGALRWPVNIPPRAQRGAVIRIVVVAADLPVDGAKDWMANKLSLARDDGDLEYLSRRLERLGITLLTFRHAWNGWASRF